MGSSTLPFSEYSEQVRRLRLKDRHFARLYEELIEINQQIAMVESSAASEARQIDDLKMRRLYLTEKLHEVILNSL